MRFWGRSAGNVGPKERWARAGLGAAFLLLAALLPGRVTAWVLAPLGIALLATAWVRH